MKMNKPKIVFGVGMVLLILFNFALAEKSGKSGVVVKQEKVNNPAKGEIVKTTDSSQPSETKEPEVPAQGKSSAPKIANYILVTDVIDGFGGQKYNGGCDLSIFAGGQSSAIGLSTSTNYNLYAGFIYPIVVKCGDANADGKITVSDVVYLVNYLFKGGPIAKPYEAGEANCDGKVTVSDVVYLVNYLFKGGQPPIC
jgi:hypothetical protein